MELKTWSYSRLSTLATCSQKYKFRYVDELEPEYQGVGLVRGKLVHEIAQNLLSVAPVEFKPEYIKKALINGCSAEDIAEIKDIEKECLDIIRAGALLAAEVKKIVKEKIGDDTEMKVEENIKFEVKKRNGQTAGIMTTYLDFHFWKGKKHVVIELKTTKRTPSDGEASLSHKKQAIIYNEGLKTMYGEFAESMDYLIVYAVMLTKEIKILTIPIDFDKFEFYDDVVLELWNQIRTANELESTGSFNRTLSDQICGWCDYRELCLENKGKGYKPREEKQTA